MKTDHSIEVECPPQTAFEFALDVTRWPEVFPPCLDAEVLEQSLSNQTISVIAKANDQVFAWQSTRHIDRKGLRITFSQAKPAPLVAYMKGAWSFKPRAGGCVVTLSHDFEIKESITDSVAGVATRDQAVQLMTKSVEDNSTRELLAIKKELERDLWKHEFSKTLLIKHSKTAIYKLLRDAANWPWLLPHCNAVDMLYEDNSYQEFKMNVQVGDKKEAIRSVRVLHPDRIEYFQPAPPPALKEHQGRWTLRETSEGVEVVSWHAVVLNPDFWRDVSREEAKQKVETAINKNSLGTMEAIRNKLGGTNNVRT